MMISFFAVRSKPEGNTDTGKIMGFPGISAVVITLLIFIPRYSKVKQVC